MSYPQSDTFIEFVMDFCLYDDILDTIQITDKKLLHFELTKSGKILHVDKTCFPRPGHICIHSTEGTISVNLYHIVFTCMHLLICKVI